MTQTPAAPEFHVGVAQTTTGTTITVAGDIDLSTVDALVQAGRERIHGRPQLLTVDLSGVPFCDSAGINGLVKLRNACAEANWQFRLVGLSPGLYRTIAELTGLGEFLGVAPAEPT